MLELSLHECCLEQALRSSSRCTESHLYLLHLMFKLTLQVQYKWIIKVIRGIEFNCASAMQGVHHVLHLIGSCPMEETRIVSRLCTSVIFNRVDRMFACYLD